MTGSSDCKPPLLNRGGFLIFRYCQISGGQIMGRKKLNEGRRRSRILRVTMKPAEAKRVEEVARRQERSVSSVIRRLALQALAED